MFSKRFSLTGLALVAMVFVSTAAFAEESNGFTAFFKKLFNYPVKATKETAEMTGNTLQNTGEKVIAKTGENTAEVLQGNIAETPKIVTDAAVGTAETVGQTASEAVQVPVKAAEDEKPATN